LLINRHVYRQLADGFAGRFREDDGHALFDWSQQVYIAFAATAIRRMAEKGWVTKSGKRKSVSLVGLLEDMGSSVDVLTRERFGRLYPRHVPSGLVDRDFEGIVRCRKKTEMPPGRIKRDIREIVRVCAPIRRLTDKSVAHSDRDRRTVGKVSIRQIDNAVNVLEATYRRYCLLVNGVVRSGVPLADYDVSQDVRRLFRSST
jgi:hypothetical protein